MSVCVSVFLCGCVYPYVSMQVYVYLCVCLCVCILCMYMCVVVCAHVQSTFGIFLCSSPFDYSRKDLPQKLELASKILISTSFYHYNPGTICLCDTLGFRCRAGDSNSVP